MDRWEVRVRSTTNEVVLVRRRGPWWAHLLSWVVEHVNPPEWRVPFVGRLLLFRGTPEETTLRDYYGDTLADLWGIGPALWLMTWADRACTEREVAVPMAHFMNNFGEEAPQWLRELLRSER